MSRGREFAVWLCKDTQKPFVALAVPTTVAMVACYSADTTADSIRYTGLTLQLGALVLVALGLRDAVKHLRRVSMPARIANWLQRGRAILFGGDIPPRPSGKFRPEFAVRVGRKSTPGGQIADLEEDLRELRKRVLGDELDVHLLRKFATKGIDWEWIGFWWLLVGITAEAIPEKLADLIR